MAYTLCSRCSSVAQTSLDAQRALITENAEAAGVTVDQLPVAERIIRPPGLAKIASAEASTPCAAQRSGSCLLWARTSRVQHTGLTDDEGCATEDGKLVVARSPQAARASLGEDDFGTLLGELKNAMSKQPAQQRHRTCGRLRADNSRAL